MVKVKNKYILSKLTYYDFVFSWPLSLPLSQCQTKVVRMPALDYMQALYLYYLTHVEDVNRTGLTQDNFYKQVHIRLPAIRQVIEYRLKTFTPQTRIDYVKIQTHTYDYQQTRWRTSVHSKGVRK